MTSRSSSLWKNRNFRLLFSATAISNLGDGVAMVAYPWLATLISKDPMDIAFVAFAARLPWFLLDAVSFALSAGLMVKGFDHFTSYETALRAPYFVLAALFLLATIYAFRALKTPTSTLAGPPK